MLPGVTTLLPCGLTTINCVFPCPAIFGIDDKIFVGVAPVAPPLGAAMTMVFVPPGVVCIPAVPAFAMEMMDDGTVRITVFAVCE